MAYTYLILNTVFMACIIGALHKYIAKPNTAWWVTLGALLVLTAIFDSVIIWAAIVGYDATKLLGIYVGYAPVEDFFYALLAAVLVPTLWHYFETTKEHTS
jgi:lycopene cyclase domain-containing protein